MRIGGLRTPTDSIRGIDLAGRVVAVGKNVTRFKPGDEVFGGSNGSLAEYAPSTEKQLAPKPPGLPFEQAATLNVAGLTALEGLRVSSSTAPEAASERLRCRSPSGSVHP